VVELIGPAVGAELGDEDLDLERLISWVKTLPRNCA